MKIRVTKSRLLEGLKKVQSAANAKNSMPVLGNVKVEAKDGDISLTTTDLDIVLYTKIEGEIDEDGAITIPVRQLMAFIPTLPDGEITIQTVSEKGGDKVRVKMGKTDAKISTISAEEFPRLPKDDVKREFTIKASVFADMIRKTSYAQSVDETRLALMSVLVETGNGKIRCVATDGRRLAVSENECDGVVDLERFILPSRAVTIVQKFADNIEGDITVRVLDTQVYFVGNDGASRMYSRMMDYEYPNYQNVIPKTQMQEVVVDRDLLISSIVRVSAMDTTGNASVKLTFGDGRLAVDVRCEDICDTNDEVPIKYNGEEVEILFNPKFVLDPLRAAASDNIVFKFTTSQAPAVIKSECEDFFCVLMPLRIN